MEGQTFKICIFSQSGLPDSEISLPVVIQSCKGIDLPIHFEAVAVFSNTQRAWKVNYIFAVTGFEHAIVQLYGKQKIFFKLFSLFCCGFLKVQRNSIICGLFCPQVILTDQVRGRMADTGECLDASMDYERDTALLHKHKLPCVAGPYQNRHGCFYPQSVQTALFELHAYSAPRYVLLLYAQQLPEAAASLMHIHLSFAEICQRYINHW